VVRGRKGREQKGREDREKIRKGSVGEIKEGR